MDTPDDGVASKTMVVRPYLRCGFVAAWCEQRRHVVEEHKRHKPHAEFARHAWTPEEDRIITESVAKFGCQWRKIAALLPNRSVAMNCRGGSIRRRG